MSSRAIGIVFLLAGTSHLCPSAPLWTSPAASPSPPPKPSSGAYWIQPAPENEEEALLRGTLTRLAATDPLTAAQDLDAFSASRPGTPASGLAQLAAGLRIEDVDRPAEAIPRLRHADIQRTALAAHALLGLGRALEATGDLPAAAEAYLAAASPPTEGPAVCAGLFGAAGALGRAGQEEQALQTLERALGSCPGREATALLRLGAVHEARGDPRAAASVYDRLDREHPASPQALEAAPRLRALASHLPPMAPADRSTRDLEKAQAFLEAGRNAEAIALLRVLQARRPEREAADLVRVSLARALMALDRDREASVQLSAVSAGSSLAAEAAYHRAGIQARRRRKPDAYEAVATRFPGTPWAEEALLSLAHHHHRDGRDAQALPYYRRLAEAYPEGRYFDRATWWIGWDAYRRASYEEAATTWERGARLRPRSPFVAGSLYWSGRARRDLGQEDRARQLFEETVLRYKHSYHGLRAQEALGPRAGEAPEASSALAPSAPPDPRAGIPEPAYARLRQLLLIDRPEEALQELRTLPPSPAAQSTIAWLEWRLGNFLPAITAMRRAHPEYVGEAGDHLPEPLLRILYPLEFGDLLQVKAKEEGLDPALVAALIWQESAFEAGAVSAAGARGLMQLVPPTGRSLARRLGIKYRLDRLHEPEVGLDLGTLYLREMVERFDGRLEWALAAYNAGPARVRAWLAARPGMSAEEFIESIPYPETRGYVMSILANRERYRRLYSLSAASPAEPAAALS